MSKQQKEDQLYVDIAFRISQMSHARRLKVGAVVVQDRNIISMGWNGTPTGMDNNCEDELPDGKLVTKDCVLHAESNAIVKLAYSNETSAGATMYCTHAPCIPCANLIAQARISRVVVGEAYRDELGKNRLEELGVKYELFTTDSGSPDTPPV